MFLNSLKVILFLLPFVIGGGGYMYIKNLKSNLELLKQNQTVLEESIVSKDNEIVRLNENIVEMRSVVSEVEDNSARLENEVDSLREKLSDHDMGYLASKKPQLIENIINRAIKKDVETRINNIVDGDDSEE